MVLHGNSHKPQEVIMGWFSRSSGRLVESGGRNYNISSDRGKRGEVTVERQDRTLWGTTMGSWSNMGTSYPNEASAERAIEDDSDD
jgi:hypothetical protein